MKRSRKKVLSILLTVVFMMAFILPTAVPAAASSTYSISNVATLPDSAKGESDATKIATFNKLGAIRITIDENSTVEGVYENKYVWLELPSDFEFRKSNGTSFSDGDDLVTNGYASVLVSGTDYAFSSNSDIEAKVYAGGNKIQLKVLNVANEGKPGVIFLKNLTLYVPAGASAGPVELKAIASSSSIFTSGKFTIANIGAGIVQVSVDSVETIGSSGGDVKIYIKESNAGAFDKTSETLKFKLPSGFKWELYTDNTGTTTTDKVSGTQVNAATDYYYFYWGSVASSAYPFKISSDGRELILDNSNGTVFGAANYFWIKAKIVPDETKAKYGDITVTVGGDSSYTPSSLLVAKYADYSVKIEALNTETVKAGKVGEKIGKFVISEGIPGSLVNGRTVTLKLPEGAKWVKLPQFDSTESTKGRVSGTPTFNAIDTRTAKLTISTSGGSSDAAKLVFKDAEVITAADFAGDLKVIVSGSQGLSGELKLAEVVPPVKVEAGHSKELRVGINGQAVSDITITETVKEAIAATGKYVKVIGNLVEEDDTIDGDAYIVIKAPSGVTFAAMPKVEVVEGDIDIEDTSSTLSTDKNIIKIPVTSASATPSKIKLSNIKLNIDRTVAEGDLKLSIYGTALVDDTIKDSDNYLFEPQRYVAEVIVGKVVTPAPGEQKSTASFKIGAASYTVNGMTQTMDVTPYIKDGRTYLPVRYVAQALGVSPDNIFYADGVVTLLKGSTAVQLTIGSNVLKINGAEIKMDVKAEINNGRTMLPFRWVAQALGATVNWDEATQTVTMTL